MSVHNHETPRLCVVTAAFPSPSEPTRAVFLKNFLAALAAERGGERRAHVSVVGPRVRRDDPLREEIGDIMVERFGVGTGGRRLKEFDRVPWARLTGYLLAGISRTASTIRRTDATLVYAHWVLPAGLIGAVAALLTARRLVVHTHGSDIHRYALKSRLARAVARWTLARACAVLAVSEDLARSIETDLGVPRHRIHVVPMGVDADIFGSSASLNSTTETALPEAESNGRLEILYVGDLDPRKGIAPLARAVAESETLTASARLHIAGDGVHRDELEAIRRGSPAAQETIFLYGRLSQSAVAKLYRSADLLVLPSQGEGAPLTVMEAMASGLPVLATPVGGIPELVRDGETGWLVEAGDFTSRIERFVDDRGTLDRARRNVRELSLDWTASTRADEAWRILEKTLEPNC